MEFRIRLMSVEDTVVHDVVLDIAKENYYRISAGSYDIRLEYIEDYLRPYFEMLADYEYMIVCGNGENAATDRKY